MAFGGEGYGQFALRLVDAFVHFVSDIRMDLQFTGNQNSPMEGRHLYHGLSAVIGNLEQKK